MDAALCELDKGTGAVLRSSSHYANEVSVPSVLVTVCRSGVWGVPAVPKGLHARAPLPQPKGTSCPERSQKEPETEIPVVNSEHRFLH